MYTADEQASRPFVWFPLAGQRHAINRRDRNVPVGSPMRCLCGGTHPRGGESKMEWLWPTCEDAGMRRAGLSEFSDVDEVSEWTAIKDRNNGR